MAEPFIAEIRIVPFSFAPRGWALCNGQLMLIPQNTALYSLLGTTYGGDGKSTFALPNLQGRAPMHPGQGPGLSRHDLGELGGSETVTLLQSQIPSHTHSVRAQSGRADLYGPVGLVPGRAVGGSVYRNDVDIPNATPLNASTVAPAGGGQPHNNMQPYLALNFIIALEGLYPSRS